MNKYGSRPIMILGGCLSGTGLIAASFCNTVEALYLFVGVITGELNKTCFTQWSNKSQLKLYVSVSHIIKGATFSSCLVMMS